MLGMGDKRSKVVILYCTISRDLAWVCRIKNPQEDLYLLCP